MKEVNTETVSMDPSVALRHGLEEVGLNEA